MPNQLDRLNAMLDAQNDLDDSTSAIQKLFDTGMLTGDQET